MNPAAKEVLELAAREILANAERAETLARRLRNLAEAVGAGDVLAFDEAVGEFLKSPPTMDLTLATSLVAAVRERDPDHWESEKERGDLAVVMKIDVDKLPMAAAVHSLVCQKTGCGVMRAINERMRQGKVGPS